MTIHPAPVLVLLEGVSDVAAVRALARVEGINLNGVELVDLHGVTNIGRTLSVLAQEEPDTTILGLCDAPEARVVQRALARIGRQVGGVGDLPAHGFFVCHVDLEDELIRALGPDRALGVIDAAGMGAKFAVLTQQLAWRGRPVTEQLRRFCGVASGRKEYLAGQLAGALTAGEAPEPLRQLLAQIVR